MGRKIIAAAAILLLIGGGLAVWSPWQEESRRSGEAGAPRPSEITASAPPVLEAHSLPGSPAPPPPLREASLAAPSTNAGETAVVGTVTDATGAAVAGATVEATVYRSNFLLEHVVVRSGADGSYRAPLPLTQALDPDARATCGLRVGAGGPRRRTHFESPLRNTALSGEIRIPIVLDPESAAEVTGIAVGPDGAPVAGAAVTACVGTGVLDYAQTAETGRFRVFLAKPSVVALQLSRPSVGVAFLADVRADGPTDIVDVGTVVLRPAGTIEGRAELPDGSPAPRLTLSAQAVGDAGTSVEPPCSAAWAHRSQTETDGEGHFAFRQLHPGRYRIDSADHDEKAAPAASQEFETGSSGVVVVVRQRFLVLQVVDAGGHPFAGADCSYEEVREDGEEGALGGGDFSVGDAIHVLEFSRPVRLLIEVKTPTLEADDLDVEIPVSRWRVDLTVVLRPTAPKGRIRIDLIDGDGNAVPTFYAQANEIGGRPSSFLASHSWSSTDGPLSRPLRPGSYAVEVTPGQQNFVPHPAGGSAFGSRRTVVAVPPGGEVVLRMTVERGGWLRTTNLDPAWNEHEGSRYAVTRDGRDAEGAIFGHWSHPTIKGRWDGVQSGGPQFFSLPLEPGRFVLAVKATGYTEVKIPFEIRAGETTDVSVPPLTK